MQDHMGASEKRENKVMRKRRRRRLCVRAGKTLKRFTHCERWARAALCVPGRSEGRQGPAPAHRPPPSAHVIKTQEEETADRAQCTHVYSVTGRRTKQK